MAEVKTEVSGANVSAFLNSLDDVQKRLDFRAVIAMMREVTGKRPRMWGTSTIGFGSYHYRYASGRENVLGERNSAHRVAGFQLSRSALIKRSYFCCSCSRLSTRSGLVGIQSTGHTSTH